VVPGRLDGADEALTDAVATGSEGAPTSTIVQGIGAVALGIAAASCASSDDPPLRVRAHTAPVRGRELVRGVEAGEHVERDAERDRRGNAAGLLLQRALHGVEGEALDVLHDQEELAVLLGDVERRDDVGVADVRRHPRLVEEHGDELGIFGEVRVHGLDRHLPLEAPRSLGAPGLHRLAQPARQVSCG